MARRLIGIGTLAALPVALSGAADWLDTDGAERRVGTVHAAANDAALRCSRCPGCSVDAVAERQASRSPRRGHGDRAAAFLGGHLAYRRGVGVDTTAFQSGPSEWRHVSVDDEIEPSNVVEGRLGSMSFAVIGRAGAPAPT